MTTTSAIRSLVLASAALAACGNGAPERSDLPPEHRVADRYAATLRVSLDEMERRPTGLYVQDVVAGDGMRADSGDIARVHYTGWLASGVEFDSSRDGEPFEVALGYGRVIDGWDQGVVGMRVGGQRRLVIPPALGYGRGGRGRIPGGATLVFDVELMEVVDRTGGDGAGGDAPSPR
ncbi:MAG TPA: FKBP-type peptidyl-prolyl cis-trans isomerase [Longimicrobiales bacterium]|nr:FKBP-type peptidyl-prolyl cis-trans isomerase [Longimicrobiales bacterium]